MTTPNYRYVENDNCKLRFWSEGSGPLLFFIPGGTAHGSQFKAIMSILSTKYTVATYDRRGSRDSPVATPSLLNPPQQANDMAAVIRALGFGKAIIFGNSLGGILAFQVGIDHPSLVDHLIAHEAPTTIILPDSSERFGRVLKLHSLLQTGGFGAAAVEFKSSFIGMDDPGLPKPDPPPPENLKNFLENEFLIGSTYNPDWRKIVRNGISVGVLAGERSKDAFYAKTTIEQANILGCPRAVVPGHHGGFEAEADLFAPKLVEFIELLEKRREEKI